MRLFVLIFVWLISAFVFSFTAALSSSELDHLFFVERSKNKNLVQYDVRLTGNDDILDSNPLSVYWVLESGKQRDLNVIQRKFAYGVHSCEKLAKNKFKVVLVALKEREIIVEKIEGSFRAIMVINGKPSVLERVYVESRERAMGLPRVLYIDLFGRIKETGLPINERIVPK
ncbi:MAG: DUF4833 domain-containing protein [Thermodesulfobacteriota bacterium]